MTQINLSSGREATRLRDPFRAKSPLVVATALAGLGCRLFPTHGMRNARNAAGVECDCARGRRHFAKVDGVDPTPCQSPGKLPRLKGWPDEASSDPEQLKTWRDRSEGGWPYANFGVVTGSKSALWILDIDGDLGFTSLAKIEAEIGTLPPTWASRSGSGNGAHFWWALPPDLVIRNSQGTLAPGVDVRGENGQALIPGSRHKSGQFYEWLPDSAPSEVCLAPAPADLVDLALEANKATRRKETSVESRSRTPHAERSPRRHDPGWTSGAIGDGEGRGGFHGPINIIAIRWFGEFGIHADADRLKAALRDAISAAPSHNHEPHELERYMTNEYLDDRIEGARAYVKKGA